VRNNAHNIANHEEYRNDEFNNDEKFASPQPITPADND